MTRNQPWGHGKIVRPRWWQWLTPPKLVMTCTRCSWTESYPLVFETIDPGDVGNLLLHVHYDEVHPKVKPAKPPKGHR
jgi:hypothetical protein